MASTKPTSLSVLIKPWSLAQIAAILLAVIYLLQLPSPLRLNTDSIILLGIGNSVAEGHGFLYHGMQTHFPPGYPALVAMLNLLGIASSASLILLNCAFLGIALASCYLIYLHTLNLNPASALGLCCMVMLSYVLIKHVTIPISDVVFMGLLMLAILLTARASKDPEKTSWPWFALAVATTLEAISVRTAGVALIPALAWGLCVPWLSSFKVLWVKKPVRVWGWVAALLSMALFCGLLLSQTLYFSEMMGIFFQDSVVVRLLKNLVAHIFELGEVGLNLPWEKAHFLPKAGYALAGLFVLVLLGRGLWLRRQDFSTVEVTLLSYCGMIFLWPYFDARFWLPILPLILGFAAVPFFNGTRGRGRQVAGMILCTWFAVTGLFALAYTTSLSWSGRKFADLYGNGTLNPSYRAVLLKETYGMTNEEVMSLIRQYDSRWEKIPSPH